MIARLIDRARRDEGMTLTEMAVVTLLLGIVMAFVFGAVAAFERSAMGGIRRLENLDEGRLLMAVLSKDIRTAAKLDAGTPPFVLSADPAVTLADDNEMTFYANLNMTTPCPKRIHLYVNADRELLEEVTQPDPGGSPPNCSYTQNPPTTRLVGQYVANDLSDPAQSLFTYYYEDANGTLVAFGPDRTPLSTADALLVEAVGIRLTIRKSTALPVAATTLLNRVRLPNVFYNPPPTPSP